jgi:hypothetical protein
MGPPQSAPLGVAGADLHTSRDRKRNLGHEMDGTEKRQYDDYLGDLQDDVADTFGGNLQDLEDTEDTEESIIHHLRVVIGPLANESEASTHAHPPVSARPVLPAPALV